MRKRKYTGLVLTVFFCFSLWVGHDHGFFEFPEGLIYDMFMQLTPARSASTEHILLIEASLAAQGSGDEVWVHFLDTIMESGAKGVAFLFLPPNSTKSFYEQAAHTGRIVFAQSIAWPRDEDSNVQIQSLPQQAQELKLSTGLLAPPPSSYGVHRLFKTRYMIENQSYPSLVTALYKLTGKDYPEKFFPDAFLVNFFKCSPSMPIIRLDQVQAGAIIPEMIRDKFILVGSPKDIYGHGLKTPIDPGNVGMSIMEYNGYALETLVEEKTLRRLSSPFVLGLLLLLAGLGLYAYQHLSVQFFPIYTGVVLVLLMVASLGGAVFFYIWPPVFELIAIQVLIFLTIPLLQFISNERANRRFLLEQSTQFQKRLFPESFVDSEEYWAHIVNMISQTLHLERSIFLEKVEKDHRVREVVALNCSLQDINERRRDYLRYPYSAAISEGKAIKVENYLISASDDEVQYLVPLMILDRILGCWAFSFKPTKLFELDTLLKTVNSFAQEISLALSRRIEWKNQKKEEAQPLKRFFNLEAGDYVTKQINQYIDMSQKHMVILESVVNSLSTATITYDTFGRVIQANDTMSALLKEEDIPPFSTTALDFAVRITGKELEEVRQLLSYLIINQKSISIPALNLGKQDQSFVLLMHPLVLDQDNLQSPFSQPFRMLGILFELLDITGLKGVYQLKEELIDQTNLHLRQDLEIILTATELLDLKDLNDDQRQEVLATLKKRSKSMQSFFEGLDSFFSRNILAESMDLFPVNPLDIINEVIQGLEKERKKRKVTVELESAKHIELIYAGPAELKVLLTSMLVILLQDASAHSTVSIKITVQEKTITYTMVNNGYGIPNQTFQQHLYEKKVARSEEFEQIHTLLAVVEKWQANFSGKSKVGKGYEFQLRLRKLN